MTQPRYEAAETLVFDPVASNRNVTRATLHSLRFRNVEFASTLEELRLALAAMTPDLILLEVGGAEAEICALVQAMRQGTVGNNPFAMIVVTTWRRDGNIVNHAINAGADDLLARPFSSSILNERLKNLIERRKDFVITASYIGPDRRRDEARVGSSHCIAVPNSLRMKTVLDLTPMEAEQRIAAALREGKRSLEGERLRCDALLLCAQWHALQQRQPGGRDFANTLARIEALSADIGDRAPGTRLSAAAEWVRPMRLAARIASATQPAPAAEPTPTFSAALRDMREFVVALRQILAADGGDMELPQEMLTQADFQVPGPAHNVSRLSAA